MAHKPVSELGFVPLYRCDGRPMVVVVREHQFEQIAAIEFGAGVLWGRRKGRGETVWITPNPGRPRWRSTIPERNRPADLSDWLCVLWRTPELVTAVRRWLAPENTPAAIDPTAPLPEPIEPHPEPWVRGVQDVAAKSAGFADFPNLARAVIQNAGGEQPAANGKHKPKAKK